MTPVDRDKRAGLLFGSFAADALSLGVHWIYDTDELEGKFGYVDQFYAPGKDSYHPNKEAGAQSHVGDQALQLAQFLNNNRSWSGEAFFRDWTTLWADYNHYFDHATKTVLENIQNGLGVYEAASESRELAGPGRIAPLVAFLFEESEEVVVKACVEQTVLTHNSPETLEATTFLASATHRLGKGAPLTDTLKETAPQWAFEKAESVQDQEAIEAIGKLGQSCTTPSALPAVIYLALRHGEDLPKAFSENAMAGGDNCARALALGMLLGAAHGIERIPPQWIENLTSKGTLKSLLK
ncbi:MAG: ADP-ribosylglycohydrolase family protein [Verrucomicrobiota bacterium]